MRYDHQTKWRQRVGVSPPWLQQKLKGISYLERRIIQSNIFRRELWLLLFRRDYTTSPPKHRTVWCIPQKICVYLLYKYNKYICSPPPQDLPFWCLTWIHIWIQPTFVIFEMNSYMNPHTNGTYEQYTWTTYNLISESNLLSYLHHTAIDKIWQSDLCFFSWKSMNWNSG